MIPMMSCPPLSWCRCQGIMVRIMKIITNTMIADTIPGVLHADNHNNQSAHRAFTISNGSTPVLSNDSRKTPLINNFT